MLKTSLDVYNSDMSDEMQDEALQVALLAVNMYTEDNDIAVYMVKEFDRRHGRSWHCIMGNCGYYVQYKTSYICFSVGDKRIVLFRTD
ncbi:dynein 8 kDa light chain, flagellar outer arm-like [Megalobrama amblycephala]|uniref:dynein 8 kDa light chain, flagellar outer arm-like n=1 Tax=Megalobrama amblycephala TaxID=75352 RepID=UPI0020142FF8|nr:dynein 8 kDa light chain, flagellar outer arm-like [Megalobrama amblycephala]